MGFAIGRHDFATEQPRKTFTDSTIKLRTVNISASRVAARHVWGKVCQGQRVKLRHVELGRNQSGSVSFNFDPELGEDDPRGYTNCVIRINPNIALGPAAICAVIIHEWGHLAGKRHARYPRKIMYPRLTHKNIPNVCRRVALLTNKRRVTASIFRTSP